VPEDVLKQYNRLYRKGVERVCQFLLMFNSLEDSYSILSLSTKLFGTNERSDCVIMDAATQIVAPISGVRTANASFEFSERRLYFPG
jgi:hypothetical protein